MALPESIRLRGVDRVREFTGSDLLLEAVRKKKVPFLFQQLPRQIGLRSRPDERTRANPPRVTPRDVIHSLEILTDRRELPLSVAQTMLASITYGDRSHFLDPAIFENEIFSHCPVPSDLRDWGINEASLEEARQQPPVLVGSVLFAYYDGMDANEVCMRQIKKGPYQNKWTIGGGHFENLFEVAAFEEAREEAGWDDFFRAVPLGTADQIVAVSTNDGGITLRHYLNLMWEVSFKYQRGPRNVDGGELWRHFDDEEVPGLYRRNELAPISICALKANGLFI